MSSDTAFYLLICLAAVLRLLIPFRPRTRLKDCCWWFGLQTAFILLANDTYHQSWITRVIAFALMARFVVCVMHPFYDRVFTTFGWRRSP